MRARNGGAGVLGDIHATMHRDLPGRRRADDDLATAEIAAVGTHLFLQPAFTLLLS
jgi:hypothetical protein